MDFKLGLAIAAAWMIILSAITGIIVGTFAVAHYVLVDEPEEVVVCGKLRTADVLEIYRSGEPRKLMLFCFERDRPPQTMAEDKPKCEFAEVNDKVTFYKGEYQEMVFHKYQSGNLRLVRNYCPAKPQ